MAETLLHLQRLSSCLPGFICRRALRVGRCLAPEPPPATLCGGPFVQLDVPGHSQRRYHCSWQCTRRPRRGAQVRQECTRSLAARTKQSNKHRVKIKLGTLLGEVLLPGRIYSKGQHAAAAQQSVALMEPRVSIQATCARGHLAQARLLRCSKLHGGGPGLLQPLTLCDHLQAHKKWLRW